jgi:hypothetical protein
MDRPALPRPGQQADSHGANGNRHGSGLCLFYWIKPAFAQPAAPKLHLTDMHARTILLALAIGAIPIGFTACNSQPSSPDQVRAKTAEATAEIKQDAQALAQGVRDGLTRPSPDKPLNLNSASKSQLMSLPGMDDATADRVIAGRPYSSEHQLLDRRIVSREEYNKIADSVTVTK